MDAPMSTSSNPTLPPCTGVPHVTPSQCASCAVAAINSTTLPLMLPCRRSTVVPMLDAVTAPAVSL